MLPVDQSSAPEMSVLRMATEGILGVMVQQVMVLSYQALLLSNSYSSVSPISMPLGGTVRVQEEQFPSDAHAPCLSNAGNTPRAAKCRRGGRKPVNTLLLGVGINVDQEPPHQFSHPRRPRGVGKYGKRVPVPVPCHQLVPSNGKQAETCRRRAAGGEKPSCNPALLAI